MAALAVAAARVRQRLELRRRDARPSQRTPLHLGGGRDEQLRRPHLHHRQCAIRHQHPFLFFQDVSGSPPSKSNALCGAHHRSLDALPGDLAAGTVASYVFITPNLCHDMHGSSCPSTDKVGMGDSWLSTAMPPLIAYVNVAGGVIFVIWDEGSKLPFLAVGPGVKPGYRSAVAFNHGSLVKSVEEMFGPPILPAVQNAADFADLFASDSLP